MDLIAGRHIGQLEQGGVEVPAHSRWDTPVPHCHSVEDRLGNAYAAVADVSELQRIIGRSTSGVEISF